MAAKNIQELYDEARVIYTASTEGENTQVRIGQMFYDLIEHLYEISDVNGTVGPITPTPTPSTLGGPLLTSFNNMPIPTDPDQILHWIDSEDKWEFIDTPTGGGSGGSGDVTWLDLKTDNGSADDNKQINLSHLKNALSGYLENNLTGNNSLYSWWGQKLQKNTNTTPATYRITNAPLEGVTYIRFANDVILGVDPSSAENTLCVYNSDLTKVGHIYATGGVSALGNSSSGGGSPTPGTPVDLRGLLSHISSSSYSPDYANTTAVSNALLALPDNGAGATIRWNGSKWIVDKTIFDDIANITDNGGSFLKKEDDGYSWSDPATGTSGSTTLSGLQDTTISSLAPGQLLYYQDATDKWVNKTFAINSTASISNPVSLQNIVFGGTKYILPAATSGTPGIMKIGNSTIQTTAANNPTTTTERTYPVQLNSDGQAVVNVPWTDNDHTYEGGNGITVGSSPSQSGNYPISVVLTDGGGLAFDNSGKLKISNTYGGTKYLFGNPYWQNGLPQSYGYDNSHLTDINYVTNIYLQSSSTAAATALTMRDPGATNDTNSFVIRKNSTYAEIYNRKSAEPLLVTPGSYMAVGQGNIPSTTIANYINGCMLWSNGSLVVGTSVTDTTSSITLGGAVLKWDETNKALYVQRKDGSAANFYATGGVSALGFSDGTGSVDAMTFGSLNVEGNLNIYDDYASYTIGVDHDDLLINCEDGNDIILGSNVYINGSAHITGNTIYMTNKWRFRIDNGTGGTNNCILEYNRGSSTPDWIQKDSWTAS